MELWGPFMTVSGTRASGQQRGGKGVVLRREMDSGSFSATWKLPVTFLRLLCCHDVDREHSSCGDLQAMHCHREPVQRMPCSREGVMVCHALHLCGLQANGKLDSLYAESVDGVLCIYLRKRKTTGHFAGP